VVAGELVDEQERLALAGLLGVQLHAVVGHDRWHRVSPYLAGCGLTRIQDTLGWASVHLKYHISGVGKPSWFGA
jgi:hypothetical protein